MYEEHKVNKKYKDSLFCFLFGSEERKQNALDLFNALNGTSYSNVDDLEITTMDSIVYLNMKNDVSLLLYNQMDLYEQQSTWNPNMPLRGLIYIAGLFDQYVSECGLNVYSYSQLHLPTPKYFVLYNGTEKDFDRTVLRLEDSFPIPEDSCLTFKADVININIGRNKGIVNACKPLYEYSFFVGRVRENQKAGMDIRAALDEAVDYCIQNGILENELVKHKSEVIGMCITEYDEQKTLKATYSEGEAKGREEGRTEGMNLIGELMAKLLSEHRYDEAMKASKDQAYCQKLLKKYNIQ